MTDKEYGNLKRMILCLCSFIIGSIMSGFIVTMRINSEIRTDQLELKAQVAKIEGEKAAIYDLARKFIFHTEQVILERQELRELRAKLSKGE